MLARACLGRPRLLFSSPEQQFFRRFSVRRTFGAQNIQHQKNTVKTNTKCTSELPRIDRKSLQNRSGSACDCVWRRERPCERLESCPGGTWSVSGMPRRAFEQLLTVFGSSGATQDRLWGSIWVSKSRPEHVRTRPRNGFGRPRRPKMDFWAIWGPPAECFFVDFLSSCLRRSDRIGISKKSRVIFTNRLGSCVVQSSRAARTSFAMTAERYMFSLLSLRTHKPT